ncbi:hypothetical protein ACFQ1M_03020 [Sungkyunkwania multivorans]|uniref:Uncharacterized protein n=1 Tax=Sungkyunkwania multivorans TaxID=1173618 RepID=A0ABW3CWF9_9FLAO
MKTSKFLLAPLMAGLLFINCKEEKKQVAPLKDETSNPSSSLQNDAYRDIGHSYADLRWNSTLNGRYRPNLGYKRYISEGEFDMDTIDIEIPVTSNHFILSETIFENISLGKHNCLLVVLKDSIGKETNELPVTRIIQAKIPMSSVGFGNIQNPHSKKMKVYVLHDNCYPAQKRAIASIFRNDLARQPHPAYARGVSSTNRQRLESLNKPCDSIKLIKYQPKESGGGVISGG